MFSRSSLFMERGEGTCPIIKLMQLSGEQQGEASCKRFKDDFGATSVEDGIDWSTCVKLICDNGRDGSSSVETVTVFTRLEDHIDIG